MKDNHDFLDLSASRPFRAILLLACKLDEYSKMEELSKRTTSTFFEEGIKLSRLIETNQLEDAVNFLETEVLQWAQKGVKRTVFNSLIEKRCSYSSITSLVNVNTAIIRRSKCHRNMEHRIECQ